MKVRWVWLNGRGVEGCRYIEIILDGQVGAYAGMISFLEISMYKRAARFKRIAVGALLVVGIFLVFQVIRLSLFSEDSQIKGVVEEFYGYEQDSDFGQFMEIVSFSDETKVQ